MIEALYVGISELISSKIFKAGWVLKVLISFMFCYFLLLCLFFFLAGTVESTAGKFTNQND